MSDTGNTSKVSTEVEESIALCIDNDHVTLSVDRYNELLKAEITLGYIGAAFRAMDNYDFAKTMPLFVGAKAKPAGQDKPDESVL